MTIGSFEGQRGDEPPCVCVGGEVKLQKGVRSPSFRASYPVVTKHVKFMAVKVTNLNIAASAEECHSRTEDPALLCSERNELCKLPWKYHVFRCSCVKLSVMATE